MTQGVNMVPVVLYNTAHQLISKVYKLGTLQGVEENRYGRGIHARNLFWTHLDTFKNSPLLITTVLIE